jgi:peptidyl-prolyl cis-trans isomerase A (cyclophilin A)
MSGTRALLAALALSSIACGPHYSRLTTPAKLIRTSPPVYRARFDTTQGSFVIEVHRDWAPLGADRFYNLVRNGFYDGQRFFRTLPAFVVQWGIPPNPAVSKAWGSETRIKDDPVTQTNTRGFVSFATSGPNTRTAAIFVNMADNSRLDKTGFAPFGQVVEGMDVFSKLYAGYGEGAPRGKGPEQKKIRDEGEAYLAREFPLLDHIHRARIVRRR